MIFSIDATIFIGFLITNLIIGIVYSNGIKDIREYAVGNKNFSTATIVATIVATCIGGGFFSGAITESYKQGLYFIIPAIGEPLMLIILGYFLVPRMAEFLGTLSVSEAMGNLYGLPVRIITAFASIILCIGIVALQFKVSASVMQIFFGINGFYATLLSAAIVVMYSALGGIKAVSFTDIIQFFTFGTIIPIITLIIWGTFNDPYQSFVTISQNPLFDFSQVFNSGDARFMSSLFLLFFFLVPEIQPVYFQRIVMASSVKQARSAFITAGLVCLAMLLVIVWVGVLLLSNNPNLDPNNLLAHIISNYSYPGLKGLTAVGIISIVMSTADSYINTASVNFTSDILQPLASKKVTVNQLLISKLFAVIIGIIAFFLAFKASTILELLLMIFSFYAPVVAAPLLLAIFGFRSTTLSALIGIGASVITVVVLNFYHLVLESAIVSIGMIVNVIFLVGSHYLLKQNGGFVGIKDDSFLRNIRRARKNKIISIIHFFKNFNFIAFCKSNAPKQEYVYSLFGFFCLISVFSTMYSIPKDIQNNYHKILEIIYDSSLISSTILLTFPIWPPVLKNDKLIPVIWNIFVPYILIFVPTLLIIISNFGQFQLMIFLLNMVIIALLLKWHLALFMILISMFCSVEFYKWYMGVESINAAIGIDLQFKIMYTLLLFSSILIAFFKPKQEYQELTEEKVGHLHGRINLQEQELQSALSLKQQFIQNVTHEYHAPMTGIMSTSQTLYEAYDKLNDEQKKLGLYDIYQSSIKLKSLDENIATLSRLSREGYDLKRKKINISELLSNSVETCRKLYELEQEVDAREFIINIDSNIKFNCDERYIRQAFDNLIINAINYCRKGKITINLTSDSEYIKFSISDNGVGIPKNEIYDIFEPFFISSRTKTPAGGRGVGLAVAKRVIEAHGGKIYAESKEEKGATFSLELPCKIN